MPHFLNSQKNTLLSTNELLIYFTFFFYSVGMAMYAPYAPVWLHQIFNENSFFVIGLVNVLPSIMLAIGTSLWGRLADKYGTKPFVLTGLIAAVLMYLSLLIFSRTALSFLIIILIGNFFISAELSNIYSLATLSIPKKREIVLSRITITMSLSWLITSPIAGLIRDTAKGLPQTQKDAVTSFFSKFASPLVAKNIDMTIQLLIALLAALCSIIIMVFVKTKKTEQIIVTEKRLTDRRKKVLSSKISILIFILIFTFTFQAGSTGFWNYHSVYFLSILNLSGKLYSMFLVITTILGMILSLLLSKIHSAHINAIIIAAAMQVQNLIFLFIRIFPKNGIMALLLYSFPFYPIFQIPLYSLVTQYSNPELRSTAYGIYNTVSLIGGVLATLMMGIAADHLPQGFLEILTISLILALISSIEAIILVLLVREDQKKTI